MAVALDKLPEATLAANPIAVFKLPVVLLWSAKTPLAVLAKPVVLAVSAANPLAVLSAPVVLN